MPTGRTLRTVSYTHLVCHTLKEQGDIQFIINTLESGEIRKLFSKGWYEESLYLLAMLTQREADIASFVPEAFYLSLIHISGELVGGYLHDRRHDAVLPLCSLREKRPAAGEAVSYTHLDVYKRQSTDNIIVACRADVLIHPLCAGGK